MSLVTESQLQAKARVYRSTRRTTTASILRESRNSTASSFDVFLCHSKMDEDTVLGCKALLERNGLTVYVDWIDDPQLDRSSVTPGTANVLRRRMQASRMLIYAHSLNSTRSKWCPWELGYFDGKKGGNVFVLPIAKSSQSDYDGQEYLGLYPYLDTAGDVIFINKSAEGSSRIVEAKTRSFHRT